ncbi:MAG TPA: ABC transporter ATP-binding protein, partial [Ilumatobacteraceae bacterium]
MSRVLIEGITKRFGKGTPALDGVNLEIAAGEMLVLLGPSGCGKTTTLRSIAGLETPDTGRITLGDIVAFDKSTGRNRKPEKRDIGMVFQNYALWPHMSVLKNISYPLRARHLKDLIRDGAAAEAAELVGCGHLLGRYPGQLSGGQQQRVALARALVAQPRVVLFDEPLSNLDAKLRKELRIEISRLHRQVGFTGVYVTHDHAEALAIGDRVALLEAGKVVQIGTPSEVYRAPATPWAADFMGVSNHFELQRRDGGWWFHDNLAGSDDELAPAAIGTTRVCHVRPSLLTIAATGDAAPPAALVLRHGVLSEVTFCGESIESEVTFGDIVLRVYERSSI